MPPVRKVQQGLALPEQLAMTVIPEQPALAAVQRALLVQRAIMAPMEL